MSLNKREISLCRQAIHKMLGYHRVDVDVRNLRAEENMDWVDDHGESIVEEHEALLHKLIQIEGTL